MIANKGEIDNNIIWVHAIRDIIVLREVLAHLHLFSSIFFEIANQLINTEISKINVIIDRILIINWGAL